MIRAWRSSEKYVQRIFDIMDDGIHVGGLDGQLLAADARKIQQVVDQPLHALAEIDEAVQFRHALGIQLAFVIFEQEAGMVVDAAQWLFEIVRGDIGEIVEFLVAVFQGLGISVNSSTSASLRSVMSFNAPTSSRTDPSGFLSPTPRTYTQQ